MADFLALWRAVLPEARPIGLAPHRTKELAARLEVGWVRVLQARVPAFDGLEQRDLAILPLPALTALTASGAVELPSLVEAIAAAEAVGILLVGDDPAAPLVPAAATEAADRDLPCLLLAPADAVAVERSVAAFLHAARAEQDRQVARLEAELERLALASAGLEAEAAALAAFLDRAVAIEGAQGEPLAVHAPPERPEAATDAASYLAHPDRTRLRLPLADVGRLVLLGERPASELDRAAAARAAGLLALAVGQATAARAGVGTAPRGESLPSGGPPWVFLMARQLLPGFETSPAERDELRQRVRHLAPARRLGLRGDASSLEFRLALAPEPRDPLGLALAGRLATVLGRPVATSRPFAAADERALAEAEARATLEAFEAIAGGPETGAATAVEIGTSTRVRVGRADRLAAYRLLGSLHNLPDGRVQAEVLLRPLLSGRPAARRQRLATLRAVLDTPGRSEAAAALGIHRNTLSYRMRRIEALTGWQLDDPDLRFTLALALRLVQADQRTVADSTGMALEAAPATG